MEPDELLKVWEAFTKDNDFKLNPDKAHVDFIVKGVLVNEEKYGLKLCPCRLRDGSRGRDLELICPCNFKTHTTWLNPVSGREVMCWCGLFVRRT
jgi:ferredoxin-thioredoxin reductase catalytic subunit